MEFEAESGKLLQAEKEAYQGASGNFIVRLKGAAQMDVKKVDPANPDLQIPFRTEKDGAWQISAVVCTETTNNDSFYYRVDAGPLRTCFPGFPRKCVSRTLRTEVLEAGNHLLSFYRREPNCGLDKVILKPVAAPPLAVVSFPGKPGPDALYTLKARPGSYYVRIYASIPTPGPQRNAQISINGAPDITRRIIFPTVTQGQFDIERIAVTSAPMQIRIRTDKDVTISRLELRPVKKVLPEAAEKYVPPIQPRTDRPRLYINRELMPRIKASFEKGPHKVAWEEIARAAKAPFRFAPKPGQEVQWDTVLVFRMQCKAFYYLFTGDEKIGREACDLAVAYMKVVNFGNGQDICRRTGEAIRVASMVYDWCYPVMTDGERRLLRDRFLWQAESMEIGWPPFLQHINTGHGNEAQLNKDLLSMAIAIYNEDPVPWKYCTYRLLEEARAIKNDLYKSGYHYEGTGYGTVRYASDITAALLLKRAAGFDQFEPHAGKVPYAWFYLRTPDGKLLTDGDDYSAFSRRPGNSEIYLVANALWPDPKLKAGYMAGFSGRRNPYGNPVYFLLMMDADQKQDDRLDDLPPVKYFGDPLSLLVARTGWTPGLGSDDVIVHLTGPGLHNSSHQHLDAGAFQIYYRGLLTSDIGQYRYFSRPYARNFAKTSMAHSTMRLVDPEQKITRKGRYVDITSGIQEGPLSGPYLPEHFTVKRSFYETGKVLSVSTDARTPHLQMDLQKSFPTRAKKYIRTMVFLAAENPALVVLDELELVRPNIKPVWQITSLDRPEKKDNGQLIAEHLFYGLPSRLTVTTLLPRKSDALILSGKEAHTVEGTLYRAPFPNQPEASASRTEITAAQGENNTRFLHILQPTPGTDAPKVTMTERNGVITLVSDGWRLVLTPGKAPQAVVTKPYRTAPAEKNALYLDGKKAGVLQNDKVPLLPVLKAAKIPFREKGHMLTVEDMMLIPCDTPPRPDALPLTREKGVWLASPSELAGFLNASTVFDPDTGSYFLQRRPGSSRIFASSVTRGDAGDWRALLDGDTVCFLANGNTVGTATFRKDCMLNGVKVSFNQGDTRTARFKLEVSADNKSYKTVFDGQSSGRSSGLELYSFPAQKVRYVRFHFLGNSINAWNAVTGIRFIERN